MIECLQSDRSIDDKRSDAWVIRMRVGGIAWSAVIGITAVGARAKAAAAVAVTQMKRETKAVETGVEAMSAVAQGAVAQTTVAVGANCQALFPEPRGSAVANAPVGWPSVPGSL